MEEVVLFLCFSWSSEVEEIVDAGSAIVSFLGWIRDCFCREDDCSRPWRRIVRLRRVVWLGLLLASLDRMCVRIVDAGYYALGVSQWPCV